MLHRFPLALGAALGVALGLPAWAYSDGAEFGTAFDAGAAALPMTMPFDATQEDAATGLPAPREDAAPPPATHRRPTRVDASGDEFQRYFDRHYRAHLVLDASARRGSAVE